MGGRRWLELLPEPAPTFSPADEPLSRVVAGGPGELWQGGHTCTACALCPPPQDGWSLVVDLCPCADAVEASAHLLLDIPDAPLSDEQSRAVREAAERAAQVVRSGGRVLVRCHWGLNRSGLVVGLALRLLGRSGPEAVERVRRSRSRCALRNGSFAAIVLADVGGRQHVAVPTSASRGTTANSRLLAGDAVVIPVEP